VLVQNQKALHRHISRPTYKHHIIFDENTIGIVKISMTVKLNKPIACGAVILDRAKYHLYSFLYERLLPRYGHERLQLCLTDTDSYIVQIQTQNVYDDMLTDLDWYDTSDYPADHPLHSQSNKKRLGKLKDELAGRVLNEFVGLRSKVYSLRSDDGENIRKAKGVARHNVGRDLKHCDYVSVLGGGHDISLMQRKISSKRHVVSTTEEFKLALSPIDNKRYVLPDGVHTLAWGNPLIEIADLLDDLVSNVTDQG
jgi:hypothetical protein